MSGSCNNMAWGIQHNDSTCMHSTTVSCCQARQGCDLPVNDGQLLAQRGMQLSLQSQKNLLLHIMRNGLVCTHRPTQWGFAWMCIIS